MGVGVGCQCDTRSLVEGVCEENVWGFAFVCDRLNRDIVEPCRVPVVSLRVVSPGVSV